MADTKAKLKLVALIPARTGSKRLQAKNIRLLAGHPLIAYTIAAAKASGIFDAIIVSTDSQETAEIAVRYGAESPFLRPVEFSGDKSPDIDWLRYTLNRLDNEGRSFNVFALLRPTSPFRMANTIQRAWQQFQSVEGLDSLRAVELCKQHPAKMWVIAGNFMQPFMGDGGIDPPWHSTAYQSLPSIYAQNASLEIAWTKVVQQGGTIAGKVITPFLTEGYEGFDINRAEDWVLAEALLEKGLTALPSIGITT